MDFSRFAIVTKVLPATSTKGTRLLAKSRDHSVTVPWDNGLDAIWLNHELAALELLRVLDDISPGVWSAAEIISAELPNGDYVHLVKEAV